MLLYMIYKREKICEEKFTMNQKKHRDPAKKKVTGKKEKEKENTLLSKVKQTLL